MEDNPMKNLYICAALALAAVPLAVLPAAAQEMANEGPKPTSALISARTKNDVPLDAGQLKLQVNGHEAEITSVTPIVQAKAEIAILIDDGLRGSFGLQIKDLQNFIDQLPAGTPVFVGYMRNGSIQAAQPFTQDHMAAVHALRVPMSSPGMSASPYLCLSDFVKQWPSNQRVPRFVLMLTNGVDPYNGSTSMMNQDSPYVQTAQEDAERAGVAVYSIFYNDAGMRGGSFSGQSYLQQVASATGGQLLSGGITPVEFAPFLRDFSKYIKESYTVNFLASATRERNSTLVPIKVKTSQPGVKIYAPEAVHPGVVE
jgi:hypothetical protein